jgi:hypothetical protein
MQECGKSNSDHWKRYRNMGTVTGIMGRDAGIRELVKGSRE